MGYFPIVDLQYLEKLNDLPNDLPYLPQGMKIDKVQKLVSNFHGKTEYVVHIINLK